MAKGDDLQDLTMSFTGNSGTVASLSIILAVNVSAKVSKSFLAAR